MKTLPPQEIGHKAFGKPADDWRPNLRVGELRTDLAPGDCRSFSVGAYVIYFREADNGIEVVRVFHGSRDIRSL